MKKELATKLAQNTLGNRLKMLSTTNYTQEILYFSSFSGQGICSLLANKS